MKAQDIINAIMKEDGVTQEELAMNLGKTQQAISNTLTRNKSIKVDAFVEMINKLGYKVVICKDMGKPKWEVE